MVIGFKEQFVESILDGSKIHTIREDAHNRWKEGMIMHMATGVRTKKYKQFAEKVCIKIQKIEIKWENPPTELPHLKRSVKVFIDGINVSHKWFEDKDEMLLEVLVKNDGFKDYNSFFDWFCEDFTGKIIHWTNSKYYVKKT